MSLIEKIFFLCLLVVIVFLYLLATRKIIPALGNRYLFYIFALAPLPASSSVIFNFEKYGHSGWAAIGQFTLSISNLLVVCWYYYFSLLVLLVVASAFSLNFSRKNADIDFSVNIKPDYCRNRPYITAVLLGALYLILYMMLEYNIGVTGAKPDYLPMKLSGFIYYSARIVLPLILLLYLSTNRVSDLAVFMLFVPIVLIGFVTMSKVQILFLVLPIIYAMYLHGRHGFFYFYLILSIALLFVSPQLRMAFFEVEDGAAFLKERILFDIVVEAYNILGIEGFLFFILEMFARLLSFQNAILASNLTDLEGVSIINFFPLLYHFSNDARDATFLTHGFYPPEGFAVGFDTMGRLIALLNIDLFYFLLAVMLLAFLYNINNLVIRNLTILPVNLKAPLLFFISFVMTFLPPLWYFYMLIALVVMVFMPKKIVVRSVRSGG